MSYELPTWETCDEGWIMDLGPISLHVLTDADPIDGEPTHVEWQAHWCDDWHSAYATSQEQAKRDALTWAQEMIAQISDTLTRLIARGEQRSDANLKFAATLKRVRADSLVIAGEAGRLTRERDAALAEVEAWKESSAQMMRNAEFYRGIVTQIGEPFGVAACTSDDGSVQDHVLALKVPELVTALRTEAERLKAAIGAITEASRQASQVIGDSVRRRECQRVVDMRISEAGKLIEP